VNDEELMRFLEDEAWGMVNLEITERSRSLMFELYLYIVRHNVDVFCRVFVIFNL